jgi:iron complex transport system ATP-binding protein
MNSDVIVQARALTFSYEAGPLIIDHLDMSVGRGSLTALIGANGSGKSTLLRLFCGLRAPTSGSIEIDGIGIDDIPRRALARRVAFVPQNVPVVFPFTSLEVVLMGRSPHLGRFAVESDEDLELARAALEQVGAGHLFSRPVTMLSAGEKQMVFVARAIAQEPSLLLLDEPSGFLDLLHRAQLVRTLRRLCDLKGVTALMVTHDLMLLEPSFDEVLALNHGRIAASGSPGEVLRDDVLRETFNVNIHTFREEGKIFVWSEV